MLWVTWRVMKFKCPGHKTGFSFFLYNFSFITSFITETGTLRIHYNLKVSGIVFFNIAGMPMKKPWDSIHSYRTELQFTYSIRGENQLTCNGLDIE